MLAPQLSTGELGIFVTNREARGDICESIMGYVYLVDQGLTTTTLSNDVLGAVRMISALIEECSWLCY